jgi:hypothetical protein
MGFDDLVDCSSFVSAAIGQMGHSAGAASHAIGELSKALNGYSHAEGYSCNDVPKDLIGLGGFTKDGYEFLKADGSWEEVKLPKKQITIGRVVKMSIVRKPLLKFDGTKSVAFGTKIDWDILEKNFGLDH